MNKIDRLAIVLGVNSQLLKEAIEEVIARREERTDEEQALKEKQVYERFHAENSPY